MSSTLPSANSAAPSEPNQDELDAAWDGLSESEQSSAAKTLEDANANTLRATISLLLDKDALAKLEHEKDQRRVVYKRFLQETQATNSDIANIKKLLKSSKGKSIFDLLSKERGDVRSSMLGALEDRLAELETAERGESAPSD